jgi:hypothetical protein
MLSVHGNGQRFKICRHIILKKVLAICSIFLNSACDVDLGEVHITACKGKIYNYHL